MEDYATRPQPAVISDICIIVFELYLHSIIYSIHYISNLSKCIVNL